MRGKRDEGGRSTAKIGRGANFMQRSKRSEVAREVELEISFVSNLHLDEGESVFDGDIAETPIRLKELLNIPRAHG